MRAVMQWALALAVFIAILGVWTLLRAVVIA